jgi:hypothetical protein
MREEAGDLGGIVLHRRPRVGLVPWLHPDHHEGPCVGLIPNLRPAADKRKNGACKEGGDLSGIALQRGPPHVRPALRLRFFNTLKMGQATSAALPNLYLVSAYSSAVKSSTSDCVRVSGVRETRGESSWDAGARTDGGGRRGTHLHRFCRTIPPPTTTC